MTKEEHRKYVDRLEGVLRGDKGRVKSMRQVADECQCSIATVSKYAKKLGIDYASGRLSKASATIRRKHDCERHEQEVKHWWELGLTSAQIAERTGIAQGTVKKLAQRIGLKHDPEWVTERQSLGSKKAKRNGAKISATKNAIIRTEQLRIMSGMKQLTNIKLSCLPARVGNALKSLKLRYGYFQFEDEPYTLYCDDDTNRLPAEATSGNKKHCEAYFAKKYGFVFKPADEDDD